MSPRPHVCFLAPEIFPVLAGVRGIEIAGGAEVQQTVIARALSRAGYRVSVLTRNFGQSAIEQVGGIAVHRLPDEAGRGIKGLRCVHPRLTDIVAALGRIGPDIVYQRSASGISAAGAYYGRVRRKVFVYACAHDWDFAPQIDIIVPDIRERILFNLGVRAADAVLVQNITQRELLRQTYGRDGEIVPNCYEEADARPGDCAGPVLWVSSIKPIKRPELFVQLAQRLPGRRFKMIGGASADPDAATLYREIQTAAARVPNLEFLGFVPYAEIGRHFDGASLFVNTSDFEGFPNTFLQSWVRGIPTLSFVRPQVFAGESGTIACDDLDEMNRQLVRLGGDAAAWEQASRQCADYFRSRHTVATVLERCMAVFERALAAKQ